MKVYGYTKDKQGIMEIENSLKAEQAFVGGLIECTALTEEIDLICNEEVADWTGTEGGNTGERNDHSRGLFYLPP